MLDVQRGERECPLILFMASLVSDEPRCEAILVLSSHNVLLAQMKIRNSLSAFNAQAGRRRESI